MWPYWFLFALPAFFAMTHLKEERLNPYHGWTWDWYLIFLIMAIMIGFRYQVGGDWDQYENQSSAYNDLSDVLRSKESGYALLNALSLYFGGIFFVNFICGVMFSYGLAIFCRTLPFPWIGMIVAIPYLVMVVAMGYSRQGVAIGLFMLGIVKIREHKYWQYALCAITTCLFHLSAIVMIPIVGLSITKQKATVIPLLFLTVIAIYFAFLAGQIDTYVTGYLDAEYQSAGAEIRVWMNVIPAIIFFFIRNRIPITKQQKTFWTILSVGAVGMVLALRISSSSTAVDRIALYWIPIQIYAYSMVPLAFKKFSSGSSWIMFFILYSAIVQFVWLNYAATAFAWLPYQFYLGTWF